MSLGAALNKNAMVRISITPAAFEAIAQTLPLGSTAFEPEGARVELMPSSHEKAAAEKTYRAIGRFVFEFSQLEYAIRYHLAAELGLNDDHFTFAAVVGSYDAALLGTVAKEVFSRSRTSTNAPKIAKLLNKYREINDERNRIAHGVWHPARDGGTLHYVPRGNLKPQISADRAKALEKLADEARSLRVELEIAFANLE